MQASMLVCGCCFANDMTRWICAQSLEFKGCPLIKGAPCLLLNNIPIRQFCGPGCLRCLYLWPQPRVRRPMLPSLHTGSECTQRCSLRAQGRLVVRLVRSRVLGKAWQGIRPFCTRWCTPQPAPCLAQPFPPFLLLRLPLPFLFLPNGRAGRVRGQLALAAMASCGWLAPALPTGARCSRMGVQFLRRGLLLRAFCRIAQYSPPAIR
jgi:hypothetical protein